MERFKAHWRSLTGAERQELAKLIGAGRRYLDNVALENERRQLSPKFCVWTERATRGLFTCEELAPSEPWRRVKDRAWPVKEGRPVLDYASD
jgi:DNA-binding transcriptional regulator YdaS (Cro superfamily)